DAAIDRQEIPHISVLKLSAKITNNLLTAGYDTVPKIAAASLKDLTSIEGVGPATATKIHNKAKDLQS
nr:helix-hairpin-helix domain-containing protein [bacterium]